MDDIILDRRRCHDCGRYVTKDRWAGSHWPRNPYPLCKKCALEWDPPEGWDFTPMFRAAAGGERE